MLCTGFGSVCFLVTRQVLGVDGTLDVKVTTSGYIQATAFRSFYPRHYGFPVFNNVSGACGGEGASWGAG